MTGHRKNTYHIPLLNQKRRQSRQKGERTFLALARQASVLAAMLVSAALMLGVILLAFYYAALTRDLPAVALVPVLLDPENGVFLEPTRLYDRSGAEIYTLENTGVSRAYLKLDPAQNEHFSPQLVQAVVALVEPGFWSGPGFSLRRPLQPEPQTIAEHLAADLLLADAPATPHTALQMRLLGAQLVAEYGRAQVLEWYLNSAYFGHLAFGAEQAASLYFESSAGGLNLAQSALLVALLSTPSLNPLDAPQAALERMQETLDQLQASGFFAENSIAEARSCAMPKSSTLTTPSVVTKRFDGLMSR